MQISQIQVANDSLQDRLVLRIGTQANEEIRVFLTRRYLREIWPHFVSLLLDHMSAPAPVFNETSAPPELPPQPSFEQPFRNDNPSFPLGSNPLLVSEAVFEPTTPGNARLILREGRERCVNLNLNADLLQALCSMLRAASEQAGWDLALAYEKPSATPNSAGKSRLH